jgi:hypothetical protein
LGGITLIQKIETKYEKGGKENLVFPPHEIDKSFVVQISYPIITPVNSIKFYGSHERGDITDLDPDMDMDYISKFGYDKFPFIECDSIEFVVIEHEDEMKSIISLQKDGFWFKLGYIGDLTRDIIEGSYLKVNVNKKNIILQHEVK